MKDNEVITALRTGVTSSVLKTLRWSFAVPFGTRLMNLIHPALTCRAIVVPSLRDWPRCSDQW
jgi:hypothetical protein